jgi:hypothetical protein
MLIANSTLLVMADIHHITQLDRNDFAALQALIKDPISSSSLACTDPFRMSVQLTLE